VSERHDAICDRCGSVKALLGPDLLPTDWLRFKWNGKRYDLCSNCMYRATSRHGLNEEKV
jgi:hypothetical protein